MRKAVWEISGVTHKECENIERKSSNPSLCFLLDSVTMSNISITTLSVKKELNEINTPLTATTSEDQHKTTPTAQLLNVTEELKPIYSEFSKSRHLPTQNGAYCIFCIVNLILTM